MSSVALAHTRPAEPGVEQGHHGLAEHLRAVAALAAAFSEDAAEEWAYLAGLWHDLGKYRPGFQAYIRSTVDAHIEGRLPPSSDKTHSAAGALHALERFAQRWGSGAAKFARPLAYVIAGHHAGLSDWHPNESSGGLNARLHGTGGQAASREYEEARRGCAEEAQGLLELPPTFDLQVALSSIPGVLATDAADGQRNPLAVATWVRMLFSALVDADFLDTEAFMDASKAVTRAGWRPLEHYRDALDAHLHQVADRTRAAGREADPVMKARAHVLAACRAKAVLPPGVFTLTVPTGGGKTLSSLAFALHHGVAYGQRRVIYAIPYTSIIEQTADVFAGIFGRDAVVEHHSQADENDRMETARSRLACENWDAPLVVTTNVQLFESLFASRTSRCRKLHRLAKSVVVLDEAQLLPPEFLQPILDALRLLVQHYGVTLVLCSATQPVLGDVKRFDPRQNVRGLPPPTAIIKDETALFSALRRTRVEWPANLQSATNLETVADALAAEDCVLAIVNTRQDAADLLELLDQRCQHPPLHLSAAMCGRHRADVIAEIRQRLEARRMGHDLRALRVVSTQLVEAGVDIDFPVVFRALAGLDSIVQAAGRCNREGLVKNGGRLVVFVRDIPHTLPALRHGANATRATLAADEANAAEPAAPGTMSRYFRLYHGAFDSLDRHGIVDLLSRDAARLEFAFRTAAERFRLVDDADQSAVVVAYGPSGTPESDFDAALGLLQSGRVDRWLLRSLQRYIVQIRTRVVDGWLAQGSVRALTPGLFFLVDPLLYHPRLGLRPAGAALDAASLVA